MWRLETSGVAAPVPFDGLATSMLGPPRVDEYMRPLPSVVHTGHKLRPSVVMRACDPRATSKTQMSLSGFDTVTARCAPSGDSRGVRYGPGAIGNGVTPPPRETQ